MTTIRRIAGFLASLSTAGTWRHAPAHGADEWVLRDEMERQLIERESRRLLY